MSIQRVLTGSWGAGRLQSPSLPLVSIVTPSFNQARFLRETIESVLNQNYPRIEYIVVDGGSNDGSQEILASYGESISSWMSEPDSGQTDALNKGFSMARGEIFAWLNSDDTYLPNAVSAAVQYLQDHPEIGMMYGKAFYMDEDGQGSCPLSSREDDVQGVKARRQYHSTTDHVFPKYSLEDGWPS